MEIYFSNAEQSNMTNIHFNYLKCNNVANDNKNSNKSYELIICRFLFDQN